jgi:hypothetical protein
MKWGWIGPKEILAQLIGLVTSKGKLSPGRLVVYRGKTVMLTALVVLLMAGDVFLLAVPAASPKPQRTAQPNLGRSPSWNNGHPVSVYTRPSA